MLADLQARLKATKDSPDAFADLVLLPTPVEALARLCDQWGLTYRVHEITHAEATDIAATTRPVVPEVIVAVTVDGSNVSYVRATRRLTDWWVEYHTERDGHFTHYRRHRLAAWASTLLDLEPFADLLGEADLSQATTHGRDAVATAADLWFDLRLAEGHNLDSARVLFALIASPTVRAACGR